jgi:hypothetical protein
VKVVTLAVPSFMYLTERSNGEAGGTLTLFYRRNLAGLVWSDLSRKRERSLAGAAAKF